MSSRQDGNEKRKPKRKSVKGKNVRGSFKHILADKLFAYLDRSLEPDVEKKVLSHLKQCDACKTRLRETYVVLQGLDNYAEKNRKACPSPETMRDLEIGKLSKSETSSIKKHLSECLYCIEFEKLYKLLGNKTRTALSTDS